ncbi:MAG: SRPBCC family protein [Planctomycetes bacterium]|nr:SRPBCC family protein [Planctomycetota bacterium]
MRRFLLISAAGFSFFVLVLIAIGLSMDNTFSAGAEQEIDAKPEEVYAFISDMDNWHKWAGWADEKQNQIEITREGPKSGVGATIRWDAKNSVGRLTITDAKPDEGIWYEVAMESDEVNAHGSVTFTEKDGKTVVVWEDYGDLPPVIGGYFRAYVNEQLSTHYANSLKRLKKELERSTPVQSKKPAGDGESK